MLIAWLAAASLAGNGVQTLRRSDDPLREAFDAGAGHPRVVVVLTSSCRTCGPGASALAELLGARPDVRAMVVWVPILFADGRPGKRERRALPDPTARFWDPDGSVSAAIVAAAGQDEGEVWNVVMLYGPDRVWPDDGAFPVPDWWGTPVIGAVEPLAAALDGDPPTESPGADDGVPDAIAPLDR
ncbi:MAG: hypothetical protein R3F59_16240 [Myxococcota bacterium]